MKKYNLYIACLLLLTAIPSFAQKETNNWFFGGYGGLTWNTTRNLTAMGMFLKPDKALGGLPDVIQSEIITMEGCFALSDHQGNLLFYSDGVSIWNANHVEMPNANGDLTGDPSSAQSGIIIPYPGNVDKYIAVTLGATISGSLPDNLSYSVVDMTKENGLGDVLPGEKNILLTGVNSRGKTGETLTSVKHANGKDYWIVAPGRNPAYFNAWKVTKDGVSPNPVFTEMPVTNNTEGVGGYMKFTPDGKYFVWATKDDVSIIIGSFDASTGKFSNIKKITNLPAGSTLTNAPYGVEYSLSGRYVYVTYINSALPLMLTWKVDELMNASDPNTVSYEEYTFSDALAANGGSGLGGVQLASDGRIYISAFNKDYLYVIDNPEEYDDLDIYKLPAGFLGATAAARLGLPSFSASWFNMTIEGESSICTNTAQSFSVTLTQGAGTEDITHIEWDFGDGSNVVLNPVVSMGAQTQAHTYTGQGTYYITVRSIQNGDTPVRESTLLVTVSDCDNPPFGAKETANWLFGLNAGLTWNTTRSFSATGIGTTQSKTLTGLPSEINGSPLFTLEGCFSLSDNDGNLLFYSDGMTVWNRHHAVMQNGTGLKGHNSSAQSGIVLPYPGSATRYIAVSLGETYNDTLAYSVVDMNPVTNGGYADGAVTEKNTRLSGHSGTLGESVSAIAHANGRDYWIVAPGRDGISNPTYPAYMNAWQVTPTGIRAAPVVTELRDIFVRMTQNGYLKFSPNGKHFAWGTWRTNSLIFGDFDARTGTFSNVKQITNMNASEASSGPYGIEFSESGKYLYVTLVDSEVSSNSTAVLRVYDFEQLLAAANPATVTYKNYASTNGTLGAIQLGPDGRMYVKYGFKDFGYLFTNGNYFDPTYNYEDESTSQSFCVIENPEEYDDLRLYVLDDFLTGTNIATLGLPSFTASWWDIAIEGESSFCANTTQRFSISFDQDAMTENIAYAIWDFGDGSATVTDTDISSGFQAQTHRYTLPGTYTVTARLYTLSNGTPARESTHSVTVYDCDNPPTGAKETAMWYFGQYGALTWNKTQSIASTILFGTGSATLKGLPVPVDGSAMNTLEGCYALSDSNGKLLFYSDGITVWNMEHEVMETGMTGHPSSAQSGIILPYPQGKDKYVSVCIPDVSLTPGPNAGGAFLSYSVIDMTQNGGLGGVIEKNTPLTGHSGMVCESVTAIRHANGRDYWIVAIDRGTYPAKLLAWQFTPTGISGAPVATNLPYGVNLITVEMATGYLKFSPDGNTFAWGTWGYNHLVFGRFDAETGAFSNIKYIEKFNTDTTYGPYGVEFTKSGDYLYVTTGYFATPASGRRPTINALNVYQLFNGTVATADGAIDKGNLSTGVLREYPITGALAETQIGAIQLGPDNRMYVSFSSQNATVVVNNPEDFYNNLQIYYVPDILPADMQFKLGLPSFTASWWNLEIIHDKVFPVCINEAIAFTADLSISGSSTITKIRWNFGDGTYIDDTNMSQTAFSQTYAYTKPGSYILTVTPYEEDNPVYDRQVSLNVEIIPCMMPVNPNIHHYRKIDVN